MTGEKITATTEKTLVLPGTDEVGRLPVKHLKRYWRKMMARREGSLAQDALQDEWPADMMLLNVLGLGLEQTVIHIFSNQPAFADFEDWILGLNGGELRAGLVAGFNERISGKGNQVENELPDVLSREDLAFWDKNGYVILRGAVSLDDCNLTIELICEHIGIQRNAPATWYTPHRDRQGIMVQLFQHPQLQKNRDTPVIRQAYEQLWHRSDLVVNTDRVGFNPPETDNYKFPGPHLHWDASLEMPMPFGAQGILYLADTKANQGAFTLVPGFQHRLENWLKTLPPQANPRMQDLHALGSVPVAGNAGDFIIFHNALPHGSSPNTADLPRFVQYINYLPINPEISSVWK